MFDNVAPVAFLLENQFPELYRERGPQLIAFTQAFFEWLEESNNSIYFARRLLELRDIDSTVDDFVVYFKQKYLADIQYNINSNVRLFVKNSLPFYRAKGSPRSIDLFFQLIYGEQAEVYYPRDNIFKLSDGQWVIPLYLEVSSLPTNVNYINKQIQGVHSNATAFVDRYAMKKVGSRTVDIFFIDNLVGNFQTGEQVFISGNNSLETAPFITGSLAGLEIVIGGDGFNIGDEVTLVNPEGVVEGAGIVANTQAISGIVEIELLNGGWGYSTNATLEFSQYVLFLSNVIVSNTLLSNSFYYFETLEQPIANITFDTLSGGSFAPGTNLYTYYSNNSLAGEAVVISVNQNTTSGNATVCQITGNIDLGVTATLAVSGNGVTANLLTFTDLTVSANVIGVSSNVTLYLTNSHGAWSNGISAYQKDSNAVGHVSVVEVSGTNTTLLMTNVSGVYVTGNAVYSNGNNLNCNGHLVSFDTTIGVVNASGSFTNVLYSFVVGANSLTTATLTSVSTGAGAAFELGFLGNTETVTVFTEHVSDNNVFGVPYLEVAINATEYGFIRNALANLESPIFQGLTPTVESIGTILTITGINPGADYDVTPFALLYEPEIAALGLNDFILTLSPISGTFVANEEITQTTSPPNTATLTINNASAPIFIFDVINGGTGYNNDNYLVAQSAVSTANAVANLTTDANGMILSFIITDFGNGFVINTSPTVIVTNATGGSANGTAAVVTANVAFFVAGEPVYSANSSANVAAGILQFEAANTLGVNGISGTFVTSNNVIGAFSNAQANITVVGAGYNVSSIGIINVVTNSTMMTVSRITLGPDFVIGAKITGAFSGAVANVTAVAADLADRVVGWNAVVNASVETANGSVTAITVSDSGYGYANADIITFYSLDGTREGTAKALVFEQGEGAGFYQSTNGFLSADRYLQDGYYYQLYSYEVRTAIPFATYVDIFKKVLHSAGMALFGAVYLTTEITVKPQIPVSISSGTDARVYQDVNLNVNGGVNTATFNIGDTATQLNTSAIVVDTHATLLIPSNALFYEVGTTIYQPTTTNPTAWGTLANLVINTTANSANLFLTNITGSFTNTANIKGITARTFNYNIIQQLTVSAVFNPDPTTQSFTIGENVYQTNSSGNTAVGVVVGANVSSLSVTISSGTFANAIFVKGNTSNASATVVGLTPASFTSGNTINEVATLVYLQNAANANTVTGSFAIGGTVVQQQKNYDSPNAVTCNTMVATVAFANSSAAVLQRVMGYVSNNAPLLSSTGNTVIYVNAVIAANLVSATISAINSTVLSMNKVAQNYDMPNPNTFQTGYFVVSSAGTIANLTVQQVNTIVNTVPNLAINTIRVDMVNGQFIVTSNTTTIITDANSGATANITGLTIFSS